MLFVNKSSVWMFVDDGPNGGFELNEWVRRDRAGNSDDRYESEN